MRPITFTIITETLRIISHAKSASTEILQKALSMRESRVYEVLRQLCEMNLVTTNSEATFSLTPVGDAFLEAILAEDKAMTNKILLTYPPYRSIYRLLERQAMSMTELSKETGQSMVGIDTILRIMKWVNPKLKRNRTTDKYFITHPANFSPSLFLETLRKSYLDTRHAPFGIHRQFVKIPELRESVCELLHLDTESFNSLLLEASRNHPESIELTSAPTTVANRSREQGIHDKGLHLYYIRIINEEGR